MLTLGSQVPSACPAMCEIQREDKNYVHTYQKPINQIKIFPIYLYYVIDILRQTSSSINLYHP